MKTPSMKIILESLDNIITDFENKKSVRIESKQDLGIIYTPKIIVEYIVSNIFRIYFADLLEFEKLFENATYRNEIIRNDVIFNSLLRKLHNLTILDPACGSGRFLISAAGKLFKLYKLINSGLSDFEIKRTIIEKNLHGIEIEKQACVISKLRLIRWLFSDKKVPLDINKIITNNLKIEDINHNINKLNLKVNISHKDFLLDNNSNTYEIIIGNPPYIENKKIRKGDYKKKLTNRFTSAFRLFDLSILFLERALELMQQHSGCLSMILTNKFLSADYGIKIRQLLLNETELKEIINISSLPIFGKTSTYPIIISFKKSSPKRNNTIIIKKYGKLNDLIQNRKDHINKLNQALIKHIPSYVFPIYGKIDTIKYLYSHFKPMSEAVKDLKIIYRPFGFINWAKHLDNYSIDKNSEDDLILIGTGNVGKYHILFNKPIKIAQKLLNVSYFKYQKEYDKIWQELKNEKIIFREIAKELTCFYDNGLFINVTGLYFIRIPSFSKNKLLCLLAILNSNFMDTIFKTMFGSLHMSGGYLRFNGSFIKRLPMPKEYPLFLSQIGKILQFLSQLEYDLSLIHKGDLKKFDLTEKKYKEMGCYLNFFKKLNNSLVTILYLENYYSNANEKYYHLKKLLYSKPGQTKIQHKYFLPRFEIKKYLSFQLDELKKILVEIKDLHEATINNKTLVKEMEDLMKESSLEH